MFYGKRHSKLNKYKSIYRRSIDKCGKLSIQTIVARNLRLLRINEPLCLSLNDAWKFRCRGRYNRSKQFDYFECSKLKFGSTECHFEAAYAIEISFPFFWFQLEWNTITTTIPMKLANWSSLHQIQATEIYSMRF